MGMTMNAANFATNNPPMTSPLTTTVCELMNCSPPQAQHGRKKE